MIHGIKEGDDEMSQLKFQILDDQGFKGLIEAQSLRVNDEEVSVGIYEGFTFVSPGDFEQRGNLYLTALSEGQVVGVLKVKRYKNANHEPVRELDYVTTTTDQKGKPIPMSKTYLAVRYIDVHQSYQRQGVAKALIHTLSDYIEQQDRLATGNPQTSVVLSRLTEAGAQANLLKVFKEGMPGRKVRKDKF